MKPKKSVGWVRVLLFLIPLFLFPFSGRAGILNAKSYLIHYAPLAQSLSNKTGIPASVILGIALIESGHGNSLNCRMLKNHFGIKGTNHLPRQGVDYNSMYRSYNSDEASFGHFCTVIRRKSFYQHIRGERQYNIWIQQINKAYYSSAGQVWVNKILKAIRVHRLHRYDRQDQQLCGSPRMNWLHTPMETSPAEPALLLALTKPFY